MLPGPGIGKLTTSEDTPNILEIRMGLVDAWGAVAVDDMGKDALCEGMTKVVIRNTGRFSSRSGISLADDVLTFDHESPL
jgi:hypothetical protein